MRKDTQLKAEVGWGVAVDELDSGGGRKEKADVVISAAALVLHVSGDDGEAR